LDHSTEESVFLQLGELKLALMLLLKKQYLSGASIAGANLHF